MVVIDYTIAGIRFPLNGGAACSQGFTAQVKVGRTNIMKKSLVAAFAVTLMSGTAAQAVELEVTHWWTSGGEAAAVSQFAEAVNNQTDHTWVDGAIAGGSGAANPVIISRILGGDPMDATQMNTGRDAEELIEAGLMLDISDVLEEINFEENMSAPHLLDTCRYEGGIYCVPVNIHSWQWMWLSRPAFTDNGLEVPTDWHEFVDLSEELEEAGVIQLAMGQQPWQTSGAFGVLQVALGGVDFWRQVNVEGDMEAAASDKMLEIFQAYGDARSFSEGSNVQDWNEATNLVITHQAAAQIMGDWAQGEFSVAGYTAGEEYDCLPGLGVNEIIDTGGDAFYFPKQDDPEVTAAQKEMAALLVQPDVQVNFNLAKGSLPIRKDVDLEAANKCMKKGLDILEAGNIMPAGEQVHSSDTEGRLEDLFVEFWNDPSITPEQAHQNYVDILSSAD